MHPGLPPPSHTGRSHRLVSLEHVERKRPQKGPSWVGWSPSSHGIRHLLCQSLSCGRNGGNGQDPGAFLGGCWGDLGLTAGACLRSLDHPSWSLEAVDLSEGTGGPEQGLPWSSVPTSADCSPSLGLKLPAPPLPGYICPEGPCHWPPASPHSLQVPRPRPPFLPHLGARTGSRVKRPRASGSQMCRGPSPF